MNALHSLTVGCGSFQNLNRTLKATYTSLYEFRRHWCKLWLFAIECILAYTRIHTHTHAQTRTHSSLNRFLCVIIITFIYIQVLETQCFVMNFTALTTSTGTPATHVQLLTTLLVVMLGPLALLPTRMDRVSTCRR